MEVGGKNLIFDCVRLEVEPLVVEGLRFEINMIQSCLASNLKRSAPPTSNDDIALSEALLERGAPIAKRSVFTCP
jgi:hypothetical protein